MSHSTIDAVAQALVRARGAHVASPAAEVAGGLAQADEAYAVQQQVAQALGWFGAAPPRYWKAGGPSRDAVLTQAPLPPRGVWTSPATAGDWPFHLRGIEAEIALRIGRVEGLLPAGIDDLDRDRHRIDQRACAVRIER